MKPDTITYPIEEPVWNSKPAWVLPGWAEPLVRETPWTSEKDRRH